MPLVGSRLSDAFKTNFQPLPECDRYSVSAIHSVCHQLGTKRFRDQVYVSYTVDIIVSVSKVDGDQN